MDSLFKDQSRNLLHRNTAMKSSGINFNNLVFSPVRTSKSEQSATPNKDENLNPNPAHESSTTTPSDGSINGKKKGVHMTEFTVDDTRSQEGSSVGMGSIKAKRIKKLANELPDIGGMEDILKLQEELSTAKEKATTLEQTNLSLQQQLEAYEKEIAMLKDAKTQLEEQNTQEVLAKSISLQELAEKNKAFDVLSLEKNIFAKQVTEQLEKIKKLEEENANHQRFLEEQRKQIELLGTTLAEAKEDGDIYKDSLAKAEGNTHLLKQKFFFSCAIALKLNAQLSDQYMNHDLNALYEQSQREQVPYEEYHKWLVTKLQ